MTSHLGLKLLVVPFALATVFSGCFEEPAAAVDSIVAAGSGAILMPVAGAPYDGSGAMEMPGSLMIRATNSTNACTIDFSYEDMDMQKTRVHWTTCAAQANATWQDGGIVFDIVEHGATGHGNKMTPKMDVLAAGWGTTNVMVGSKNLTDPITGASTFNVHFMVTKQAMLQTGYKVYKADKTTVFDPKTPGDGYVTPNKMEAHMVISGAGAFLDGLAVPRAEPSVSDLEETATGASYTKTFPIHVTAVASTLSIDASLKPGGTGQLTFTLKDPAGTKVGDPKTLGPTQQTGKLSANGPLMVGDYVLEVAGVGAQAAYTARATVTPPAPYLMHVVFQKVTLGEPKTETKK